MGDIITIVGILVGYVIIAYIHWEWGYQVAVQDAVKILKEAKKQNEERKEIILRETLGDEGKTTCL